MCHVQLLVVASLRSRSAAAIRISPGHQIRKALLLRGQTNETGHEVRSAFRGHQDRLRSADMLRRVRVVETIPAHVLRLHTRRATDLIMLAGLTTDLRRAQDHIAVQLRLREIMDVDHTAGLRLRLHTEGADQCHLMAEVEHRLMAEVARLCRHTVEVVAARADSVGVVAVTCRLGAEVTRHPVAGATVAAVEATTADITESKYAINKSRPKGRLFY